MNQAILELLPTGTALEREIEDIEARTHDEHIRRTITERIAIAKDPRTVFIPHKDAFAASRARLLAKLTGNDNA